MSETKEIYLECTCQQQYEVGEEHAGEVFDCNKCGREITVPDMEFSDAYRSILKDIQTGSDFQRAKGYTKIAELGGENAVPAVIRGVYDGSRTVVNSCLVSLLTMGDYSRDELMKFIRSGALKVGRLVSAIQETDTITAVDDLCDMVDAGLFGEGEVSQMIKLFGSSQRQRAIPTLKSLRRAYPNLAMLVDNALANYKHLDSQVNKIPDMARKGSDDDGLKSQLEKAAQQATGTGKKGCGLLLFVIVVPLFGMAGALTWAIVDTMFS